MIKAFEQWLDDRTGYRKSVDEALFENIPGGSRWVYVTGSMLVFAFVTQAITGIFLWMFYSAGSQNAWESVYWIQNKMQGGWFLRGVHHYMAQGMVILLPLHMVQVIFAKAYVKPREINYWLGLVLLQLTLALGLTGYLLPWDQKGYWATKVATELMSLPPGGEYIQKLVVGGGEYGHYTLTRFFAMHAGVLPILLIGVLALHVAMFRRHGITAHSSSDRPDEYFWPKQVFKDAAACLVLLIAVVIIVVRNHGAELGPPAEPTEAYGAARPEWYYLFLFQLLKHSPSEFIGAIVIPGVAMGFLFLMPLIAKIQYGHIVNVVTLVTLLIGAGYLTVEALQHDSYTRDGEPEAGPARILHHERANAAEDFQRAKRTADHEYERIKELIQFQGIPREGARAGLVYNDPEIQGPRIFTRNCASCHSYQDASGQSDIVGIPGRRADRDEQGNVKASEEAGGAPNLFGFGSRMWISGLLDKDKIQDREFFGDTIHKEGEMASFVQDSLSELDAEQKIKLEQVVKALSAEAQLVSQHQLDTDADAAGDLAAGRTAMSEEFGCLDCHKLHDEGELGSAPDLTGYGSAEWLYQFIANAGHERFYGDNNDRMPAFAASDDPSQNLLSPREITLLVRWLRGDDKDLAAAPQNVATTITPEENADAAEQPEADSETATDSNTDSDSDTDSDADADTEGTDATAEEEQGAASTSS